MTAMPPQGTLAVDAAGTSSAQAPRDLRVVAQQKMASLLRAFRLNPVFWLGVLAITVPTLYSLMTRGWNTEAAGHAPIVFGTAIWLFVLHAARAKAAAVPGSPVLTAVLLGLSLLLYLASTITGLTEVQALATYFVLVSLLYGVGGRPMLAVLWFPVLYSIFLVPIPDTFIDIGTQPVKIGISNAVVWLLSTIGYPVASSGVSIFIGQFELLIAAACAGLNSLISLTAIGSFYVYLRHNASWRYTAVLLLAIFPIAVFANFIRVLFLVLLTYYGGEAMAQGFLHEFAGLFMFVVAVGAIFLIDAGLSRLVGPSRTGEVA